MTHPKRLSVDKTVPGHWSVTLDNPPINLIDDSTYDELFDLVEEFDGEPALKVVTFESANPDFFIAHYSSAEPRSRFAASGLRLALRPLQTRRRGDLYDDRP